MKCTLRVSIACGAIAVFVISGLPALAATNIFSVINNLTLSYVINGVNNPNLALVRGYTYTFDLNAANHPFWIKTIQGIGPANGYTNGVSGNGTEVGAVIFAIPTNAPSLLYYNCQFHSPMTGQLNIEDPPSVRIAGFSATTNLVFRSTGTTALNVRLVARTNLTSGTWLPASFLTNSYSDGTNITVLNLPAESVMFFQVNQDLP